MESVLGVGFGSQVGVRSRGLVSGSWSGLGYRFGSQVRVRS